ncbi:MAG: phage shock protein operon transcriptional activator [Desulfovibrionaceae bacterium]|jgi:psp operon transcriptional activator|nr:phage shock protein operon transcriptional activator [Desulfovibrionaceae bacterium]
MSPTTNRPAHAAAATSARDRAAREHAGREAAPGPVDPLAHALAVEPVGRSDAFLAFQERLSRAARADRPVLLAGERGTGKELAAARLHYLSSRWQNPLVTCNCAALPEALLEAELFGHEAGAFTGAVARRAGRFEAAHTGALFLDEIGSAPLAAQEKILRAVEYGVFERVGSTTTLRADVRVFAAANVDLPALVRAGRFKADLLDRLSFEVLTLPPLRARHGDVELLAEHFAARMAVELGLDGAPEFTDRAMAALLAHSWPGNVRELKNVVERAVFRAAASADPDRVDEVVLDPFASPFRPPAPGARTDGAVGTVGAVGTARGGAGPAPEMESASSGARPGGARADGFAAEAAAGRTFRPDGPPAPFAPTVRAVEIDLLRRALRAAGGRQKRAAALLDLTYHQLRGLLRKYADDLAAPDDR